MKGARGGKGTGGGTEAKDDKGQPQKARREREETLSERGDRP